MNWHLEKHPFGETPVFFLIGEKDEQVTEEARKILKQLECDNPKTIRVLILKDVEHDPFATRNSDKAVLVMHNAYLFLEHVVLRRPDISAIPFIE
jgi:alpha-beta hydrolase superfamily lysophospholipase